VNFSFVEPWHLFLPREGGHVVSLSGSGGKTSLLQVFARQLADEGILTIVTSTTRTEALAGFPVVDLAELSGRSRGSLPSQFFLRDGITSDGKWRGLSAEDVDRLVERFSDRVILVEVDGSAEMPLKFYQPGEPVWPHRTSLAVIVMSMAAVGEKAGGVVHRFGKQPFEPLADLAADALWLWDHSLTLLTAPGGYLAQVPSEVPAVLVLTGMASQDDSIGLFEFAGKVMEHDKLPLVVFCETTGDNPTYRTSCRQDMESGDDGA
jgi:probable selenium-dependent hydroxylase accessory protein YqeC